MNVAHRVVKAKEIQHPPTLTGTYTLVGLSALPQRTSGPGFSLEKCQTKDGLLYSGKKTGISLMCYLLPKGVIGFLVPLGCVM